MEQAKDILSEEANVGSFLSGSRKHEWITLTTKTKNNVISVQESFLLSTPLVVRALVAACAANAQGVAMLLERC